MSAPTSDDAPNAADPVEEGTRALREQYQNMVRFFGRHFVSLCGSYLPLGPDGRQVGAERLFSFSGFVVSFCGQWFFLTAGHVLKGLDAKIRERKIRLLLCGFKDDFGPDAKTDLPTPIDYGSAIRWYVDRQDLGLDVGVIHLRDLYRRGLEANGVEPIEEANCINLGDERHEAYILYGLPDQMVGPTQAIQTDLGDSLVATVQTVLLPVDRTDQPHRVLPELGNDWFIGTVQIDWLGVRSIVGMSGGPIFGLNSTAEGVRYRLVALQSWWDPGTRTVSGFPAPPFVRLFCAMLTAGSAGLEDEEGG